MGVAAPNAAAPSASVATGPTHTSSPSKSCSHSASGRVANTAPSSAASASCPSGSNWRCGELGPLDQLAEPREELRLERPDRQMPSVGGRVDPVAGEAAGEKARERIAAQPVRDEPVRAVRHRDRQPGAATRACPLEQRCENLGHCSECARCEVGRLERRQARRRVLEHARPAEVVQVVTRPRCVRPFGPEARDRAVDGRLRHVVRADAQPFRDARPEAFEDHVGAGEQGSSERKLRLQVDRDRLLAGVQRLVPGPGDAAHRVAVGLLEPDDPRAEPQQLAGRERARQVAGHVDDEHPCERLHRRANVALQCERVD